MINALEGIPGSGKSYEAVVYHVLSYLEKGRKVITNLPLVIEAFEAINPAYGDLIEVRRQPRPVIGTWDVNRVDDRGNGSAFEVFPPGVTGDALFGEQDKKKDLVMFGGVWDYYSTWKHPETGQGPVFIVDECHVSMPVSGTDPQLIEWFKLHRHFNADVLLATQNFRDVSQPIARLIGMLIKVRNADILGKRDHYIRKVYSGYRGAVISTEERKYKPAFFALYKSHSQGNSVGESSAGDIAPLSVKFQRFSRVFYFITFLVCVYAVWRWFTPSDKAPAVKQSIVSNAASTPRLPSSAPASSGSVAPLESSTSPAPASAAMQPYADNEIPQPYALDGIHITGMMKMGAKTIYTFVVSRSTERIGTLTSEDLKLLGYRYEALTACAGTLRYKGTAKSVSCDAPSRYDGSQNTPVVLGLPAGSTQPVGRSDGLAVASK